ncbi:hypothetical protein [Rhizobium sp. RU36D]|uniref:hypothetical protein n=1 Tax=Rhizobium sp. RU36D TaxID=1907415 RepID=UPI0009D8CCC3|nr:hypothetical protein [Rhizobium sp. RU36D]SMC82855.1 hypothetical protein SAMN05880593_107251 [Rhizobium sp. RU36D]
MTTLMTALVLSAVNLGLIWLLMAAPLGNRTIKIQKRIATDAPRAWSLLGPGARFEQWNSDVLASRWSGGDPSRLELSYKHPDRHGRPTVRGFRTEVFEAEDRLERSIETSVTDDSALDIGHWKDFRECRAVRPVDGGALVTVSQTDRYRGAALLIYRYMCLRAEMSSLARYIAGQPSLRRHPLTYPAIQTLLAILSTLMLWPFFGLSERGLMISALLTIVILLHEFGHMAAYRAFGHTHVRLMFIPLLGGIAIGSRPYANRFEVATCALMGSGMSAFLVPALTAADQSARALRLFGDISGPLMAFLLILGAFNLLNLLPMHRFDGGQVLRQVFRGRGSQMAASMLLTGVILWIGWRIGVPPMGLMAALAVFTLMSLIGSAGPRPRDELADLTPAERLLVGFGLFAAISIHGYAVIYACDRLFG